MCCSDSMEVIKLLAKTISGLEERILHVEQHLTELDPPKEEDNMGSYAHKASGTVWTWRNGGSLKHSDPEKASGYWTYAVYSGVTRMYRVYPPDYCEGEYDGAPFWTIGYSDLNPHGKNSTWLWTDVRGDSLGEVLDWIFIKEKP